MNRKENRTGELSYFTMALLAYLKESHLLLAGNREFINVRANNAAETYERSVRHGATVTEALELAKTVLYQDLRFSKFDTVFEVVSEWFPEVLPKDRTPFCLKILPLTEVVFQKYSIDDNFETSPSYHTLILELTGFIQINIEQYGI